MAGNTKMIDKSIPEKSIVMKLSHEKLLLLDTPDLPDGFSIRLFKPGDEFLWAETEASVLEFENESYAQAYFMVDYYFPHLDKLKKRCLIITKNGKAAATVSAWETNGQPLIHWLAVKPEFQGYGLGKSILIYALLLFKELNPNQDIIVHTRTWSHKAVCLYHSVGFNICKTTLAFKNDGSYHKNEYTKAMEVLKEAIPENIYNSLLEKAVN